MCDRMFALVALCLVSSLALRVVPLGGKDCEQKEDKVCNGAVVREKDTTLQLCVDGKLKYKKKEEVTPGYALWPRDTGPGKDCVWYGTTFCDGDLVEDLNRWWFRLRCSKSVMRVSSRSWVEVVKDPRYQALVANNV